MRQASAFFIAVISATALTAGELPEKVPQRSAWRAFVPGSWIIVHEIKTLSGKKHEARFKDVLLKHEDESPILERASQVDGQFAPMGDRLQIRPGGIPAESDIVKRRKETLTIGDHSIPCAVLEYKLENREKQFSATLAFWHGPERKVPYRDIPSGAGNRPALLSDVVRADYAYQYEGNAVRYSVEVIDFACKVAVDGRDLTCVKESISFEETAKEKSGGGSGFRWLSSEVPGHEVRFILEGKSGGAAVAIERNVLAFKATTDSKTKARTP